MVGTNFFTHQKINMENKVGDEIIFFKQKWEDIYFTRGEVKGYSCIAKEILLKGIITNISKDETLTVQVLPIKNSEFKEKEVNIKSFEIISKNIPNKNLGIWT